MEVKSIGTFEVAKKMTEFDNVSYVACGIGASDVSIQIVAKDTAEIYQFVTEVVRKVPGVRKTTTSIVPLVLKDVYQWRIPERVVKGLAADETAASDLIFFGGKPMFGSNAIVAAARAEGNAVGSQFQLPLLG